MKQTAEVFYINYQNQKLKVQPLIENEHVHYEIFMNGNYIEIYMTMDIHDAPVWHQVGIGRSLLAHQLGEKIVSATM